MDSFFTFVSDKYPIIGIVVIVAFLVYKATMYHVSIQNTRKKVNGLPCDDHRTAILNIGQKVNGLPCDDHRTAILNIGQKVNGLPCDDHHMAILNIEKTLLNKKKFKARLTVAKSPRKLSEAGLELYRTSGIQKILEANIPLFIGEMEAYHPDSALDIEDLAYSILLRGSSGALFKPVKDWLFNNPVFNDDLDIDMSAVCYVASIELRDAYLKKYPEMIPE